MWLVNGQSNVMAELTSTNTWEEDKDGFNIPHIRYIELDPKNGKYDVPQEDVRGYGWKVSSSESGDFSALGLYFAKFLQENIDIPVGVIQASEGATPINEWMSGKKYYNAMINPLSKYPLTGVLWYQGETDRKSGESYEERLAKMTSDWRNAWGNSDLPFLIVQLPSYDLTPSPTDTYQYGWENVRQGQMQAVEHINNTALIVTADLSGESDNIHPTNKRPVGERAAIAARGLVYGEDIEISGPIYSYSEVNGNKMILHFEHANSGLKINGDTLNGFKISADYENYVDATANIVGNTVEVYSEQIDNPVSVKYGYSAITDGINLYNNDNLPAGPFRTDTNIRVKSIKVTDEDNQLLEGEVQSEKVVAKIELVNNNTTQSHNVNVIISEYNSENELINVEIETVELQRISEKELSIQYSIKQNHGKLKLFVWENVSSDTIPLMDVLERSISID